MIQFCHFFLIKWTQLFKIDTLNAPSKIISTQFEAMTERTGHLLSHKKKHLSRHDWFHIRSTRYTLIYVLLRLTWPHLWSTVEHRQIFIFVIWSSLIQLFLWNQQFFQKPWFNKIIGVSTPQSWFTLHSSLWDTLYHVFVKMNNSLKAVFVSFLCLENHIFFSTFSRNRH